MNSLVPEDHDLAPVLNETNRKASNQELQQKQQPQFNLSSAVHIHVTHVTHIFNNNNNSNNNNNNNNNNDKVR